MQPPREPLKRRRRPTLRGYLAHEQTHLPENLQWDYAYRGTSLTRKCTSLGPYRRPIPRVLGGS